jgi:hypothetical protein
MPPLQFGSPPAKFENEKGSAVTHVNAFEHGSGFESPIQGPMFALNGLTYQYAGWFASAATKLFSWLDVSVTRCPPASCAALFALLHVMPPVVPFWSATGVGAHTT